MPTLRQPTHEESEAWATTIALGRSSPSQDAQVGSPLTDELRPGDLLGGRYELVEQVGTGAFGVVFRAHDRMADETVAIKILRYSQRHSPEAIQRMRSELRTARKVAHPGVVRIHDVIDLGDRLALTMEFVEGETLYQRMRREPKLDEAELRRIAIDLAQGLTAAHAVGVVHCDLKPANIILRSPSGHAVITDFGISRFDQHGSFSSEASLGVQGALGTTATGDLSSLTDPYTADETAPVPDADQGTGSIDDEEERARRYRRAIGTPPYMAPELFTDDNAVGPPIDCYALGVVLYEMACGKRPHENRELRELIRSRITKPAVPIKQLRGELSRELELAIDGCLARRVEDRLTCEQILDLLIGTPTLSGRLPVVSFPSVPAVLPPVPLASPATVAPVQPRPRWALLIAALVLPLIAGSLWWWSRSWLPWGQRRVLVQAVEANAQDRWLAQATRNLAASWLREHERRFTVADTAGDANVVARLALHRDDGGGITLGVEYGPITGRMSKLPPFHGASIVQTLEEQLPQLGNAVGGKRKPAPDITDAQAAEMQRLGVRSPAAYRLYGSIISSYHGTMLVDVPAVERGLQRLLEIEPGWPHAYAALALVQGRITPAARQTLARAREVAWDNEGDRIGKVMLQSLEMVAADRIGDAIGLMEETITPSDSDVLALNWLGTLYGLQQRTDEETGIMIRLNNLRPDLQFGTDLASVLDRAGRRDEVPAVIRAWFARAPESEQALAARIALDLTKDRREDAERHGRDLLLLHGETPLRLLTLCDVLIGLDKLDEAHRLATRLVNGQARERALGRYRLGLIYIIEGRFAAAHDTLTTALEEQRPFGGEAEFLQTLEALIGLDQFLDNRSDADVHLETLAQQHEQLGLWQGAAVARFEQVLLRGAPAHCPPLEPFLEKVPDSAGRTNARRDMLRAAAEAKCASCREVLDAGISVDERSTRSIFRYAKCAAAAGALKMASARFERAATFVASSLNPLYGFSLTPAVLARYHLAQIYEQLGERQKARAEYERFLRRWEHADRPLSEIDQAQRALQRLQ